MAKSTDQGVVLLRVTSVDGARDRIQREVHRHAAMAQKEPGSKEHRAVVCALRLVLNGPKEGIPAATVQMQMVAMLGRGTRLSRDEQHAVMDQVIEIVKSANTKPKGPRSRTSSYKPR